MRPIAALLCVAASAGLAAPAAAAPPGNGLEVEGGFACAGRGGTTIVHSQGSSAYIGDQHYVVASFAFTPVGGSTETKTQGQKAGLAGSLTCSKQLPEGTFTVVLAPVPPGG